MTKPLTEIATELRAKAPAAPGEPQREKLAQGLYLTMLFRPPIYWQLSLSREGAPPSPKEVEICRRDFGLPDGVRVEKPPRQMVDLAYWYTIRLKWETAAVQMSLIDEGEQAVLKYYQEEK